MSSLNVNPEFNTEMEQLTPETRAHADRFNERYGQLLGNDAFLKGKLEDANTNIKRAMAVAQGKSAGYVFNTYSELITYIAVPANVEKFRLGDQFLIKATDVPDYWWDNTVRTAQTDSAGNVISGKNTSGKIVGALVELEARKIDLSKYDVNDAALFNNMSDLYSSARTYDVGDICIYNNNLYKCVTAVEAAETFAASKWNKTSLAALHADHEERISANNLSLDNCLKSVSDGKSTVASAITAQGVSTAADAEFATMATNIASAGNARYNSGYSKGVTDADNRVNSNSTNWKNGYSNGVTAADNRANANSVNYKTGYNAGYRAGVSAGGSGKYRVATGTTTVNFPAGEWSSVYIPTGLSSVAGGSCGFQNGNEGFSTESFSGSGEYLVVRARGNGRQGVTARWTAYGS